MLYKVTPMMPEPADIKPKVARVPGQPRKRRKTAIYDADGNEVLITLMCLKCKKMRPLMQFGLRKMADGAIRNQPWCRTCRSGAGTPKDRRAAAVAADVARLEHDGPVDDAVAHEQASAPSAAVSAIDEPTLPDAPKAITPDAPAASIEAAAAVAAEMDSAPSEEPAVAPLPYTLDPVS
jgi:hypothetical protein